MVADGGEEVNRKMKRGNPGTGTDGEQLRADV